MAVISTYAVSEFPAWLLQIVAARQSAERSTSALASLILDDYNDNVISPKWSNSGGGNIVESGQQLRLTTGTAAFAYYVITWQDTLTMTGKYVGQQLVNVGNQSLLGYGAYPIALIFSASNEAYWVVVGSVAYAYTNVGGVYTQRGSGVPHVNGYTYVVGEDGAGNIVWNYSPDGVSWFTTASIANPFGGDQDALAYSMVGTDQANGSTTTMVVDNFGFYEMPAPINRLQTFDGQTPGAAITTGNSATGGDPFTAVSVGGNGAATYVSTAFRGDGAGSFASGTVAGIVYAEQSTGNDSVAPWYVRMRMQMPVLPSDATGVRFALLADGASSAFQAEIRLNNAGRLDLRSGAGASVGLSTAAYTAGQWIDVGFAVLAFSATVGQIQMRLFDAAGGTVETVTSSANLDTLRGGGANKLQVGMIRSATASFTVLVDDVAQSNQDYPVLPAGGSPATVSASTVAAVAAVPASTPVVALIAGNRLALNEQSFTTGEITSWTGDANTTLAWSNTEAADGTGSLRLTSVAAGEIEANLTANFPTVTPGEALTGYAWMRSPISTTGSFWVDWKTGGGAYLSTTGGTVTSIPANTWTQVPFSGTAPATSGRADLYFHIAATAPGQQHYVDTIFFGLSGAATAAPTTVAATGGVGAPTVTAGAAPTPATAAATAGVPAPTVRLGVLAAPSTVTASAAVAAPTVRLSVLPTPAVVAAVAAVPAPTVRLSVLPTPPAVAATAAVGAPTVTTGAGATPTTVAATAAVPAATVQAETGATVTASTAAVSASVGAAAVSLPVAISPPTVAGSAAVGAPAVRLGVLPTPGTVAAVTAAGAPTVTGSGLVVAATVAGSVTVAAPTVRGAGLATPATVAGAAGVGAPTVRLSALPAPATVAASAAMPAPGLFSLALAAPPAVAASAAIPGPSVQTASGTSVSVSTVPASAGVPTAAAAAAATAAPATVATTAGVGTPTVRLSVLPARPTVSATAVVAAPSMLTGSVLAAAVVAATAAVAAPAVTTGNAAAPPTVAASAGVAAAAFTSSARPAPATVAAATAVAAPTVRLSVAVVPATVAATVAVPAPAVRTDSTFTTGAVAATAAIPAPSVGAATAAQPTVVAATAAVGAPTLRMGAAPSPGTLAASAAVSAAAALTSVHLAAATVAVPAVVAAPTVSGLVLITPVSVAVAATIPAVVFRSGVVVAPVTVAATVEVGAISHTVGQVVPSTGTAVVRGDALPAALLLTGDSPTRSVVGVPIPGKVIT